MQPYSLYLRLGIDGEWIKTCPMIKSALATKDWFADRMNKVHLRRYHQLNYKAILSIIISPKAFYEKFQPFAESNGMGRRDEDYENGWPMTQRLGISFLSGERKTKLYEHNGEYLWLINIIKPERPKHQHIVFPDCRFMPPGFLFPGHIRKHGGWKSRAELQFAVLSTQGIRPDWIRDEIEEAHAEMEKYS